MSWHDSMVSSLQAILDGRPETKQFRVGVVVDPPLDQVQLRVSVKLTGTATMGVAAIEDEKRHDNLVKALDEAIEALRALASDIGAKK